jgi:serine/threonine-protein kinase
MLTDIDLSFRTDFENNNEVEENRVISQDTVAGLKVLKNRVIGLTVSLGPNLIEVPKLTGLSRREAETLLANRKLTPDFIEEYDDNVPADEIIKQFPLPDTKVKEKETIQMTVSMGRKARPVAVPYIEKSTLSEGQSKLEAKNLNLGKVTYKASDEYASGIILSQEIAAETVVDEGTDINVTVSEGPGPVKKAYTATYLIPQDERFHTLSIKLDDIKGSGQEVYSNEHFPGTMVSQDITYYSRGTIYIYLDGEMVYSEKLE